MLTFKVIKYCWNAAKSGDVPTLNDTFEGVADEEKVSRYSVERAYRENIPILLPYLKLMGAPILFPD